MIVADTGAILALIDRAESHHADVMAIFESDSDRWILPWAILPEVDYLVGSHLGSKAAEAFLHDLANGSFRVEWGEDGDLERAHHLARQYRALKLGLVDATVIAVAERLRAEAIATLDLRHFGAVAIKGRPALLPRDRHPRR
jgi:predicted nucleic acid-binding protein